MTDNLDTYGTESGLIDKYIGTVEEVWFAIAGRGMSAENFALNWKVRVDEIQAGTPPANFDGTQNMRFGCGRGWASYDGGKTVEDPNNPERKLFHRNSGMGKLVTKAIKEFGMGPLLGSRGPAQQADVWHGCQFVFELVSEVGSDGKTYDTTQVVEFLGVRNDTPAAAPVASNSAPVASPVSEPTTPVASNGAEIDPTIKVKLAACKSATGNHLEFLDKVMQDLPEVISDDTLMAALADGNGLYAEL